MTSIKYEFGLCTSRFFLCFRRSSSIYGWRRSLAKGIVFNWFDNKKKSEKKTWRSFFVHLKRRKKSIARRTKEKYWRGKLLHYYLIDEEKREKKRNEILEEIRSNYWKYFAALTRRNFSTNNSESKMAMCAARPIKLFVPDGIWWKAL